MTAKGFRAFSSAVMGRLDRPIPIRKAQLLQPGLDPAFFFRTATK
jgi:hypothetical protein